MRTTLTPTSPFSSFAGAGWHASPECVHVQKQIPRACCAQRGKDEHSTFFSACQQKLLGYVLLADQTLRRGNRFFLCKSYSRREELRNRF